LKIAEYLLMSRSARTDTLSHKLNWFEK